MTFSSARLADAVAELRAFDGRELAAMEDDSFGSFQEAVASAYRLAGVAAAEVAAEAARRSDPSRGAQGWSRQAGHVSPRAHVARSLGVDERDAQRLISAGTTLAQAAGGAGVGARAGSPGEGPVESAPGEGAPRHVLVAAAFDAGRIGAAASELITSTLDALPETPDGLEARLVAKAERVPLRELRRACESARALHDRAGLAETERRHRAERELHVGRDADGMTTLRGRLDAASAAPVLAWLDAQVRHAFQQRRDDELVRSADRRSAPQVRVDALVSLARHALGCDQPGSGVQTEVVVRVDMADLADELALASCDSVPQPITVATARQIAVDARILPAVMGGGAVPLDWGRARRLFTPDQRKALVERDGGCAWCLAPPSWCVVHHVRFWSEGGETSLENGALLCTGCHVLLHSTDWTLELRDGMPWLIPPASVDPDRTPIRGGVARVRGDEPPLT